jgi:hypothetical protein
MWSIWTSARFFPNELEITLRNKFMIALTVAACIASVSEACPFGRRKAKGHAQAAWAAEVAKPAQVVEGKPVIVPVAAVISTCVNGSCGNQALQVGPTQGFRLFR